MSEKAASAESKASKQILGKKSDTQDKNDQLKSGGIYFHKSKPKRDRMYSDTNVKNNLKIKDLNVRKSSYKNKL